MGRTAKAPRPGVKKQLPVKLPPEIEIDLHIFCEVHYGTSRTNVIAAALDHFIREKRATDPVLEAEFTDARARFMQTYLVNRKGLRLLKGPDAKKDQPNSVRRRREPQE